MMTRSAATARADHYRQQYLDAHYSNVQVKERTEPYLYIIVKADKGPCEVSRTIRFKE